MRLSGDERRELVVRAAVAEFAAGGFHGTPMERIAERAGVSQPYLFRLFPSKLALFQAAVVRGFRQTADCYRNAAEGLSGAEALTAMARARRDLLDDAGLLWLRLHSVAAVPAVGDPGLLAMTRRCWSELRAALEDCTGATPAEIRSFLAEEALLTMEQALAD